jgi:putative hemolysin
MDLKFWLEIAVILILIFISGFFAASEIAVVAVRKSRIKKLARSGNSKAAFVEKLKDNPDDFFGIIQVGVTVAGTAASALGGAAAIIVIKPLISSIPITPVKHAAQSISIVLVVVVMSYLFLVLAELVPKSLAIRYSERIALWVGPITWWFLKSIKILISFLSLSTNICLKIIGIPIKEKRDSVLSEEEVKIILAEGLKTGVFEPEEQKLIHSVFEFSDTLAKHAMTPRTEIVPVEINDPPKKILEIATTAGFSRLPVFDENLDQIKGIIHVRDLLNVFLTDGLIITRDIMRPPVFVPDSKKIADILADMQKQRMHIAIVLDDYGGTAGIITLEDILEELVGEIQDEYDSEEDDIVTKPDGSVIVKGLVDADLVWEQFGIEQLPESEFESIAGLVIDKLGRIPALNESIKTAGLKITILEKSGHKVGKLLVEKIASSEKDKNKQEK